MIDAIAEAVNSLVERTPMQRWVSSGLLGAAIPLALAAAPWTGTWADVGLLALGTAAPLAAWSAVRLRSQLETLPLAIAPVIGTGSVDGVRIYRFRLRLGRGRRVLTPSATVSFEDVDGERYALAAHVPADDLIGPFTIVCPDPRQVCAGPGRFVVQVACDAPDRAWTAQATLDKRLAHDGWFGGVENGADGVRFTSEWGVVVPR